MEASVGKCWACFSSGWAVIPTLQCLHMVCQAAACSSQCSKSLEYFIASFPKGLEQCPTNICSEKHNV